MHSTNKINQEIQNYLLKLTRFSIAEKLDIKNEKPVRPDAKILQEKRGVFVTLEIDHKLRGCIGNIDAIYPLEQAVQKNAVNAAFFDPRFPKLEKSEFLLIDIEISILTVPQKLEFQSSEELLNNLTPHHDGVIIKQGNYQATYLPQVWDDLPDKGNFLSSLCAKAGLPPDSWQNQNVEVFIYQVQIIEE